MQKNKYSQLKKLANIWNFLTRADKEYLHSQTFNQFLITIYFFQLFGLPLSLTDFPKQDEILQIICFIAKNSRITPLLTLISKSSHSFCIFFLISLLFSDITFYIIIFQLSLIPTYKQDRASQLKIKGIQYIKIYTELFKWFFFIIKTDIAFGGIFCTYIDSQTNPLIEIRCSYIPQMDNYKLIFLFFCLLQLLFVFISCFIYLLVYNSCELLEKESYFKGYFFIFGSFLFFIQKNLFHKQINSLHCFNLSNSVQRPLYACQFFEELIVLTKRSANNFQQRLIAFGIISNHMEICLDIKCPCFSIKQNPQFSIIFEPVGVSNIRQQNNYQNFKEWIYKFIDYNLRQLLTQLKKSYIKQNQIFQDVSMRFWFFSIRQQRNYIKSLYIMKSDSDKYIKKSFFLKLQKYHVFKQQKIKQKIKRYIISSLIRKF
ncbi:hypothetical protein IMG5_062510 [Ichthyophthirius multifiliis]|uniref:Transmembrane protein n=1 Tax=Ichthyophthirius multifiliis TaxID=5932 RepID=G0QNY6_ICHMU|nr:hypothetical protein IMG5_062510 [Ichthyophthirius multifiliis]EGR33073.1 hypothetical protein IMG5_062510 [Ichthyophthirius multifiliis]|eukprot:XP_004037059.1 hypothetical protein IMG5_062510 [Ichthyophthirius multifiliis]